MRGARAGSPPGVFGVSEISDMAVVDVEQVTPRSEFRSFTVRAAVDIEDALELAEHTEI